MHLSVIIPAFNEARHIEACVTAVRQSLDAQHDRLDSYDIVVCDNNSSDTTGDIARQCGATVVFEPHNQISRARNAGARAATGDWLLFVDADTIIYPETIADLLDHVATGRYVGGGCDLRFDRATWFERAFVRVLIFVYSRMGLAGGSFVFCRADAFREVGGFSEELYAAEEVALSKALRRWGKARGLKFVFLTRRPITTSARKLKSHGWGAILRLFGRVLLYPRSTLRSRAHLDIFYDGKR